MEEGLLVVRLDGSVQAFDGIAERLLGLRAGELRIGASLTSYLDCEELRQLLRQGPEASGDGRLNFAELPMRVGGRALVLRWTSLSGEVTEAPSLLLKIRTPPAAADAETARALVSRLSRELRAPVAAIRGCSATLLGGALDELERARRFVEMVQHNASQLEQIADDLSALAQVEPAWIESNCSAVEVGAVLAAVAQRLGEEGVRRGVGVRPRAPAQQRLCVMAVAQLFEQSLLALASELMRSAKPGEEITCEALLGDGEDAAQITLRRRVRGTAAAPLGEVEEDTDGGSLRLATVRDVVCAHGGRVRFESAAGQLQGVRLHWPLWGRRPGAKLECYDRVTAVKFA